MSNVSQPTLTTIEKSVDPVKKIYKDANQVNVAKNVIYTANKTKFTYDPEGKNEVLATDMFNLFVNGVVCIYNKVYYTPLTCTEVGVITFGFPT